MRWNIYKKHNKFTKTDDGSDYKFDGKVKHVRALKREHFICEMFETLLSPLLHA